MAAAALPLILRAVPRPEEQGWRAKGAHELTLWASEAGRVRALATGEPVPPGASLRIGLPAAGRAHGAVALVDPDGIAILFSGSATPGAVGESFEWTGSGDGWLVAVLDDRPVDPAALARAAGGGRRGRGGRCGRRGDRPAARARGPVIRAIAAAALVALASRAGAAEPRRFALVAGAPDGGPGTVKLRYAERDARRMHGILTRVGGVRPEDARLLLSAGAGDLVRALAELSERAGAARARGERTVLLVYYSGHAKDGALRLGSGRVPFEALRAALEAAPRRRPRRARRLLPLGRDRAREGRPARARLRGVRRRRRGRAGSSSSRRPQADEDSQESDAIGASWFTHHLASGLLGGADASGDGRVTLSEAYAYAYARTVGSTASSAGGVQHPVFLYDLGGAGDLVLTDLAPVEGGLVLPAGAEGLYVVLDGAGRAVAEVAKGTGAERRVALPPGRYTVKKRLADDSALLVAKVGVTGGAPAVVEDAAHGPRAARPRSAEGLLRRPLGARRRPRRAALLRPGRAGRALPARDARRARARGPRRSRARPRLGLRPGAGRRRGDAPACPASSPSR